jgi:tetratricopeptide (TPR) repeat protein
MVRSTLLTALLLGAALCFGGSSSSAQESNLAAGVAPAVAALQRVSSDLSAVSRFDPPNLVEPRSALADSRPFHQRAVSALLNNSNDSEVVNSLLRLDEMYPSSGTDGDAGLVWLQVLRIAENALRLEDSSVVDALLDLAVLRRASGDIDGAIEIYRGVLAIRSTVLEPKVSYPVQAHPSARLLSELHFNDLEQAEARFEQEVERRGAVFGSEPSEIASSLDELGSLYHRKGRFALARAQFARAVAIREERLGRSHPQVASSLSNLANSYYSDGKFVKAETHFRRARVDGLDKPVKGLEATLEPKFSQGDDNFGAFQSKLQQLLVTFQGITPDPLRPDLANRKGDLRARLLTIEHIYEDRFLPLITEAGFGGDGGWVH